jgi:hypothetical protein
MKKETFLALVIASVLELKANATPEELAKLDFAKLDPNSSVSCILGQITGHSRNTRAFELHPKTLALKDSEYDALRFDAGVNLGERNRFGFQNYTQKILEVMTQDFNSQVVCIRLAPFEFFILMQGANTEELFQFLKGERDTFEPKIQDLVEA